MPRQHFNLKFFKRFWRVVLVVFPGWKTVSVLLFVVLLCLVLLEQFIIYQVGLIPSKYYTVLGNKDLDGFKQLTIVAVLIILSIAFVVATKKYVCSVFYVTTRLLLTKHLHEGYFADILYYTVNVLDDTIDNPDQRITQDVDRMTKTFSAIIADLLISPFTIAFYTYRTWSSMGFIGPVCVILFFIVSTVINKFLMSPVVSLVFRQEQLEGDFRFKHMMIRSNAESAAFYRCGHLEWKKTNKRLKALTSTQQRLNVRQYVLNFSIGIADYLGSILSYVILAIPIFAGLYDELSPADLSSLISQNAFVTIYLISSFTRLIDMAIQVADVAGTTHRIIQLDEVMLHLRGQSTAFASGHSPSPRNSARNPHYVAMRADNLTVKVPHSDESPLIESLSFELQSGTNILVTGDSGCGKSSLFRVLAGLWANSAGSIARNVVHGYQGVLFLPQKPYLTDGTLRDQIIFPYTTATCSSHGVDDDQLIEYLRNAGLHELYRRTGGLDSPVSWNWYDMLSPGEMQRLSFVRLFFHRPPFAFLDEATSQVGLSMECHLYVTCDMLKITVLSVGHRDSLREFHQVELHVADSGRWQLRPILSTADNDQVAIDFDDVRF